MRFGGAMSENAVADQGAPFGLFLVPWRRLPAQRTAFFEQELARELGGDHALQGKISKAVAVTGESDDVLFKLREGTFAQVHLTFTQNALERPGWPSFRVSDSLGDWMIQVMIEDHVEHLGLF